MSDQLEVRVARIESDVAELAAKFDGKFDSLKDKLHSTTVWALLLLAFAFIGALLTALAKGFKWI